MRTRRRDGERRFHDLRHTTPSLLLAMGVHPKVVQEMLGHATIAMTMDTYSHIAGLTLQREAVEKLNALFASVPVPQVPAQKVVALSRQP